MIIVKEIYHRYELKEKLMSWFDSSASYSIEIYLEPQRKIENQQKTI